MERRYNLRPRVSGRVQAANTTQHFRPQQYVLKAGVPPSSDVHSLRLALLSAEEDNLKLSSENAALQEVNQKLMNDNSCLQRTLERKLAMAKQNIHRLETALEATKAGQGGSKREGTVREKEKEISSLRESLRAANDLQQMQTDCQRKVSQLQEQITQQQKVISTIRDEIKARTEEHFIASTQLSLRETELDQSINKCNALDEKFKKELTAREESWDKRQKEMEMLWQEKEDALISSLQKSLCAQKEETERVQDFWMKESDKTRAAFESDLNMIKSECDAQRSADLQQMQTDCQRKVSQLQEQITEQEKVISTIRDEIKARTEEHFITSSQLSLRQIELDQSINKCNALDEKFKKELAEREESWKRRQEEMEKLWQEKEDALMKRASKAEEELKLVIIKNIHLQELALKKKKKKKRGFWGKKRQKSSSEEEEAAMCSAQAGQEETKKEKKEKKRGFWSKKKQKDNSEEEGAVCSAQTGQEEERKEKKEKKRGFWSWARKKNSSHNDSKVKEGAARPPPAGQQ